MSCRWRLLGAADEVHSSAERRAILEALKPGGGEGMHIAEIMAATGRGDRNALDQLLFKMQFDGLVKRVKRGVYAIADKIDKKVRTLDGNEEAAE